MNLETIPLSKLVPAACNVRNTGAIAGRPAQRRLRLHTQAGRYDR